jgi:membrane complex biogenesis BtpA family protein
MKEWMKQLFQNKQPIIAMAHIPALPGTPRYDPQKGMDHLVNAVKPDIEILLEAGVDAILFCNEDDRPYLLKASIEQIAAMAHVVTRCAPEGIPFGVDFMWDADAAIAIAYATGASFTRGVLTGTYESDMGLWSPSAGDTLRFKRRIGAEDVKVFFNVVPEFGSPLGTRTVAERAKSAVVSSLADVILISGPMAGAEPPIEVVKDIKAAIPDVPVFLNTGAREDNIEDYLNMADGVIVGSSLKEDGYTWNRVDRNRAMSFMKKVNATRSP